MNYFKPFDFRKAIVFVLLIAGLYFIYKNGSDLKEIWQKLELIYLYLATIISGLAIIFSAYKLKLILDISFKKNILFREWLQVFVRGFLMNNFIPYSGVVYRGFHLKKYYAISYTDYLSSSYLFALVSLVFLLCSVSVFLSFHHHVIFNIVFVISLLLFMHLKLALLKKFSTVSFKNQKISFYISKLKIIGEQLQVIINSRRKVFLGAVFFTSLLLDFFTYAAVFHSFRLDVQWYLILYIYLSYSLSWLIKLTPGNIMVQELLMGGATSMAGLGATSGVTLSILLRCINLVAACFLMSANLIFRFR